MPHLWIHDGPDAWVVLPLEADAYALAALAPHGLTALPASEAGAARVLLARGGEGDRGSWVAVAPTDGDVRVNGLPLALGVRALSDRDEIRVSGAGAVFFSTEVLARSVPFPGASHPVSCPRCMKPIETGVAAVRCPKCGVWHHSTDELPCWTYNPTCQLCDQVSALDAGYGWSPAEL